MNLYQVSGTHKYLGPFTAGFCLDAKGDCWEAAPIIKWFRDKPIHFLTAYAKDKGWKLEQVS